VTIQFLLKQSYLVNLIGFFTARSLILLALEYLEELCWLFYQQRSINQFDFTLFIVRVLSVFLIPLIRFL